MRRRNNLLLFRDFRGLCVGDLLFEYGGVDELMGVGDRDFGSCFSRRFLEGLGSANGDAGELSSIVN